MEPFTPSALPTYNLMTIMQIWKAHIKQPFPLTWDHIYIISIEFPKHAEVCRLIAVTYTNSWIQMFNSTGRCI